MPATAEQSQPHVTLDDVPILLDDWARDWIAANDAGLGYSPRSALAGFNDPPTSRRPGTVIPRAAVDGYGTDKRQLLVATDNAIARLPEPAKQHIAARYLSKPRLNCTQEAKFFKVCKRTLRRDWREIRETLQVYITAYLLRNG